MNNIFRISFYIILFLLLITGCTGKKSGKNSSSVSENFTAVKTAPEVGNETRLLLRDLEEGGDYVNSQQYPSLIRASLVNDGLEGKNLVIDLRPASNYKAGHIKGSVNKKFEELPGYFETGIKPFEFEKIILVCDDGQISSYATSLLRMKGYGNVFAMRWGMSAWNMQFAGQAWLKGISGKYESVLDTVTHLKPEPARMPDLSTGYSTGREIGDARFAKVFSEGTSNVLIRAEDVFSNPDKYFVINLERKDKYADGHIPGAIRYKPDATLGIVEEMSTIPFDRTVVLYCGTGHNSAFATAYLRLFGYDARTLRYGNSSFMYDRMVKQKAALSWIPFTGADVNNFSFVK